MPQTCHPSIPLDVIRIANRAAAEIELGFAVETKTAGAVEIIKIQSSGGAPRGRYIAAEAVHAAINPEKM
jgi:hypothetical protein